MPGAVALIDALGFRGIWQRYNPGTVVAELDAAKNQIEAQVQSNREVYLDLRVAFLSDTIAVSALIRDEPEHKLAWSVIYLSDVIVNVLDLRLRSNVPLAYRGAIAVGDCRVSPHFLSSQSRSRRQQVEGCGNFSGMSCQRAPLRRIHRIPSSTRRFSIHGRPPLRCLGGLGSKGAIFCHCASVSNEPDRAIGPPSALLILLISHLRKFNYPLFKTLY